MFPRRRLQTFFSALCSRLRCGILYRTANEEGCDAIVLGRHHDDALETFMVNLFHGGRPAAMTLKSLNDERGVYVSRLAKCALKHLADESLWGFSKLERDA